ncbi:hypothetical protein QA600_17155 [Natronococcus sp. A-GB1]|uniref:hypothetical protein n=1 Tax=Natronococcus sp. A-GB1 TaxID=3037648 RepID=UPI00241FDCBA|nr:hypothetical protein [Natronococcus sp. A-GB1]MDG5761063.1 hypothetical protein [Natronococcus sp. A-GB1]
MDHALFYLSIPFAIIAGTGAGLLALLSWRIFRESPFGMTIGLLVIVMSAATIYHTVLLTVGTESTGLRAFRAAIYTILALTIWIVILQNNTIQSRVSRNEEL